MTADRCNPVVFPRSRSRKNTFMSHYRPDLAAVHDAGFDQLATGAARTLTGMLARNGIDRGRVVDLGCGSGTTARILADAGHDAIGIDTSPAFIELARARVPEGRFEVASFVNMAFPDCMAVCAIGEVLNYTFDVRNDETTRPGLFARIFAALEPGGLFLLDVAGPDRAPDQPTRTFARDRDWAVLVEASVQGNVLTRRITTFRRSGELFRRDDETHSLELVPPETIEAELCHQGFEVERLDAYGDTRLPPGLHGFAARKPR